MSWPAQAENPYAGQGSVLLDIGDDVGAVVVTTPDGMEGVEVEIRPEGGPGGQSSDHGGDNSGELGQGRAHTHHRHVAVVARPIQGGRLPSLVFPEVQQGRYGLYLKDQGTRVVGVTVRGGEVTQLSWPPGWELLVET